MLDKTEGIVLKTVRYAETSLIVTIFTKKHGILSFIVQGVRSSKNKQRGNILQPLNLLQLEIYLKEQRNLNRIKEQTTLYIYKNIHTDFIKQSIAIFCIELISKCIKEHEVNEPLYNYLSLFLTELDVSNSNLENKPLFFLLEVASILGFEPALHNILKGVYFNMQEGKFVADYNTVQSCLNAHETNIFKQLLAIYYDKNDLKLSGSERKIMLDKLLLYYRWHVSDFMELKSPQILSELLR